MDVRSHGVWLEVRNFIWVSGVHGWRAGLKNRERWFDSTLSHHRPLVKAIIPVIAVDDKARLLPSEKYLGALATR